MSTDQDHSLRVPFSLEMFTPPTSAEELACRFLDHGPSAPSRGKRRDTGDHLEMLAREFSGQSLLAFRHAWLIVRIRRGDDRAEALEEFRHMWDGFAHLLVPRLDLRWLVSAADTFLCHPRNPAEADAALAGILAANIAKLYETERLSLGVTQGPRIGPDSGDPLFDGMTAFKVGSGDMLVNLVERMRQTGSSGPAGMLTRAIVDRLFASDTVLRRMTLVHQKPETRPAFLPTKVALFNDTAGNHHYGCQGVMRAIDDMIRGANAHVIYRHHTGEDWQRSRRAKAAIRRADLVIVNGEGSIHHSSKRARELAAIGAFCRAHGVRSALINATIEANDAEIMADIAQFDHVWVRESASSAQLCAAGIPHAICPDLTMTLPERQTANRRRSGQLIVDSVVSGARGVLGRIALGQKQPLLIMKRHRFFRRIQGVPRQRLAALIEKPRKIRRLSRGLWRCADHSAFRDIMAGAEGLTTGRFHAMCYAVLERTPFRAIASNTSKIEATLGDIGLGQDRLFHDADDWAPPHPFTPEELTAIDTFLRRARAARDRMAFELFGR